MNNEQVSPILNGIYTIQSPTGSHRTFRIHTQASAESQLKRRPGRQPFAPGKRIIGLLTGPQNTSDYTSFGFVDDGGIRLWRKYADQVTFQQYAALVWSMATEGNESRFVKKGASIMVEGRCIVCNRVLTTPQSIRTGIGPVCSGGGENKGKKLLDNFFKGAFKCLGWVYDA